MDPVHRNAKREANPVDLRGYPPIRRIPSRRRRWGWTWDGEEACNYGRGGGRIDIGLGLEL
jgi:hypothetical protein